MKLQMVGAFWRGALEHDKLEAFAGWIEVNEKTLKFTGELNDRYGHSTIEGVFAPVLLRFVKIYDADSYGAKSLIAYLLQAFGGAAGICTGGWKGVYVIELTEADLLDPLVIPSMAKGKAYCAVFPAYS